MSHSARLRPFHFNAYHYSKKPIRAIGKSLCPRKGNSHFETSKLQVIDSAHIQANQPPLVEETAGVFFSKTTNINLMSPISTLILVTSNQMTSAPSAVSVTLQPGANFSKVPITFQSRKAVLCSLCLYSRWVSIILKIIKWNYQLTKQNWPVFELRVGTGLSGSLSRRLL